jgi:hypothetical protein
MCRFIGINKLESMQFLNKKAPAIIARAFLSELKQN